MIADYVVDGDLCCENCLNVGVIVEGRPSFLLRDSEPNSVPKGVLSRPLSFAEAPTYEGDWIDIDSGRLATSQGSVASGRARGRGVVFEVGMHSWSGVVRFAVGDQFIERDLYSEEPGGQRVVLTSPFTQEFAWSAKTLSDKREQSSGNQLILRQVRVLEDCVEASPPDVSPENNGNEYPPILADILAQLPNSAVVVDLGGGDRRHPDTRVLNLEYLPYRAVDLFGDGLCLPIASQSVDLVLSQAVLEHVTRPEKAVDEIFRILKPGGQVYADFAFMQPLHAVPHHYFNVTPQGASFLFKEFDTIDQGTYGGSRDTLAWIFRLVEAQSILGEASSSLILDQLATLESHLSPQQLAQFASVVFVHARKPTD